MKKFLFLALALFLSSTLIVVPAMAEKEDPPEPPPIFQTRVVNDETEPVPVQGVVVITDNPGVIVTNTVPITGTVEIGNLPAVQPVEVTNLPPEPLKEPVNRFLGFDVDSDGLGSKRWDIPEDKQLTVETVSMQVQVTPGVEVRMSFSCLGPTSAIHFLKPWATLPTDSSDDDLMVATEAIKCHIPPGEGVVCLIRSTEGDREATCEISGYLENVP